MKPKLLLEWWDLVYVLSFGFGFLFLTAQILGFDYHDLGRDPDRGETSPRKPAAARALGRLAPLMGLDRAPFSIVLTSFFFSLGTLGYFLNRLLEPLLGAPALFFPLSLATALAAGSLLTCLLSRGLAALLPKSSSHGCDPIRLLGRIGEALHSIQPGGDGAVRARDDEGNLVQLRAFNASPKKIPGGDRLLILEYDRSREGFSVRPLPEDLAALFAAEGTAWKRDPKKGERP